MNILRSCGLMVTESQTLPGRSGRFSPIPPQLHPRLYEFLRSAYPNGLYAHQAKGLEAALDGESVGQVPNCL